MRQVLFTIILFSIFASILNGQTNSVTLKNASGIVLSQHSTIQLAYNSIPSTLTQAYIIEINNSYTGESEIYPISFTSRTGSSGSNTITLRPAAGNLGEKISDSSSISSLILLDGIDFMMIDGRPGGVSADTLNLKIENTAVTGTLAGAIELRSNAAYNTVQYLTSITHSETALYNMSLAGSGIGNQGNHGNSFRNCKVSGGNIGIYLKGFNGIRSRKFIISECDISDFLVTGISMTDFDSVMVEKSKIYQTGPVSSSNFVTGIRIDPNTGGTNIIRKNKIYDLQSSSTSSNLAIRGIHMVNSVSFLAQFWIYNNFIALTKNNNNTLNTIGAELNGNEIANMTFYYNTIYIGGSQVSSAGIVSACIKHNMPDYVDIRIRNNLFYNDRQGSAFPTGGWYVSVNQFTLINNNNYYNTTTGSNAIWLGTPYTNIAQYKAAANPHELQSRFEPIFFVSPPDLHLTGSSIGNAQLKGVPISGYTDDIDGNPRSTVAPYMGADEPTLVQIQNLNSNVDSYNLLQNYPNPFNPLTNINFSIKQNSYTTLKVYDVVGREVETLFIGELKTGSYSFTFDGSKLSSGIYYYTLSSGEFVQTKAMVLVK